MKVERAHDVLMATEEIHQRLQEEWKIDDKTIMKFKLGWSRKEGRLYIPIYYCETLVDIRKYKFDAKQNKYLHVTGVKVVYLFPEFNLYNNELFYVEGEKEKVQGDLQDG